MPKAPHDDLFEGTTMTFGEHLEELRVCLFKSVIGLAIGVAIGLYFATPVVRFFQTPLERAMRTYFLQKAMTDLRATNGELPVEAIQVVSDKLLVPEPAFVEPAVVIESLRSQFPDQFPVAPLSPHRFVPADLIAGQEAALARRLIQAGQEEKPSPDKRLWAALSAEQQQQLEPLAEADEPWTAAQRAQLVAALNAAVADSDLHAAEEFRALTGPGSDGATAASQLRASLKDKPDEDAARRLNRLLIAGQLAEFLHPPQVNLVELPLWKSIQIRFQSLTAEEAFMIWLKASMVVGLVLASPWIFLQVWNFVAAGLYPHEKNYVYIYLPMSLGLFFAGSALCFVFVFDPVLNFLFQFNASMNVDPDPRIGNWLSFVLILPLGFGLSFQLPLVMLLLNRIGMISLQAYIEKWRIAILAIFVIAMVLTPADPVSMLLMAIPLTFLYFLGIGLCRWMPRQRNPFADVYEP